MILSKREQTLAIVDAIADRYEVSRDEILGDTVSKNLSRARWHAMALVMATFPQSYPHLGRAFGKDHSSCIYAIARHFGWSRQHGKGLGGAAQAVKESLELMGPAMRLEGMLIVGRANASRKAVIADREVHRAAA